MVSIFVPSISTPTVKLKLQHFILSQDCPTGTTRECIVPSSTADLTSAETAAIRTSGHVIIGVCVCVYDMCVCVCVCVINTCTRVFMHA